MLPRIPVKNEGWSSVETSANNGGQTEENVNKIETTSDSKRRLGRTLAVALGVGMAIAAQAAPATAEGAQTYNYSFKGQSVEARFYTQAGCEGTEAFVHAIDGRIKVEGRPEAQSGVFVAITRFDICTQQHLGSAIGFNPALAADALEFDRLDGAALEATVQMNEFSPGGSYPVSVQLQWTGVGGTMSSREHTKLESPGFRVNARESGTTRSANVSGVLSDGTVDYTSGAWASGRLSSINAGSVAVIR